MSFHLGKPILVMMLIALISSGFILTHHSQKPADLVLWVFADAHATTYRSIIGQFEKQTGLKVDIQQIALKAEVVRLESMFMSGQTDHDVLPDVAEMEIGQVGRFFLPPVDQVGFEPLNDYLKRENWDQRIVPTRFAPWSKNGTIFGVPHDVHPVTITYRNDLFEEAGIHLDEAKTWPEFQDMCLKFQDYWKARGYPTRHAMDLKEGSSDYVIILLLQRGINLIDKDEKIRINEPLVAKTVAFYAQLVTGKRRIGWEGAPDSSNGLWIADVVQGNLCAFFTPDWRIYDVHSYGPELKGKMRMMALPKFANIRRRRGS
jgi:arabinosaccharide transport system substrate-binding protein